MRGRETRFLEGTANERGKSRQVVEVDAVTTPSGNKDEPEPWDSGWTSTFYLFQACEVQLQVSFTPLLSS